MGRRWQFMFAVGEVVTLAVIALFLVMNLDHKLSNDIGNPSRGDIRNPATLRSRGEANWLTR